MSYISQSLVDKVSTGPSESTASSLQSTRNKIIELLGSNYEVFLQGSYKNDTAISDINDIDIVAVRTIDVPQYWEQIYDDIILKVSSYLPYSSRVLKSNKCVKLNLQGKNIDIIPACRTTDSNNKFSEPIYIFNRQNRLMIKNYPKTHYARGSDKNQRTNQKYKKAVRLLKNFVNSHNIKNISPSFYLECLVYSYSDQSFNEELIKSFYGIVWHVCYGQNFNFNFLTVAGDKTVISDSEWKLTDFSQFKTFLSSKSSNLASALNATTQTNAGYYFRQFFKV